MKVLVSRAASGRGLRIAAIATVLVLGACVMVWLNQRASLHPIYRPVQFDIHPKALDAALMDFGVQCGAVIVAPTVLTHGKRASAVHAVLEPEAALQLLLEGSGLTFTKTQSGAFTIQPGSVPAT